MTGEREGLRDAAQRVLGETLPPALADAADDVLIRHVVMELLDAPPDRGPTFYRAAFVQLSEDPRLAQARRHQRQQAEAALRRAPPAGSC